MASMFDWNDLKYFLSVAEEGSTLKAAKALGANQTTVARRVSALEAALDTKLFERRQAGYRITARGSELLALAQEVANAANAFDSAAAAANRSISGTVRLTTNEIYSETVLTPLLLELRAQYPKLKIALDHSHKTRDLGAGEADVGFRVARRISGDAMVARKIGQDRWTFYCSKAYAEEHGLPRRYRDLKDHRLIGGGGPGIWNVYKHWLDNHMPELEPELMYDTTTGLLSAVRAGLGLAVLPCFTVQDDETLVQVFPSGPVERHSWLVTHERVRDEPHVRAVMDYLGDALVERAKRLGLR